MKIGPDVRVRQEEAVGGGEVISHYFQYGKYDMEAVCDVESCQDVVETVASHVLGIEDNDAEEVTNQSKASKCLNGFTIVLY